MNLPSNTPPDGDFAAYIERLTRTGSAAASAREDLFQSPGSASAGTPFGAGPGMPSAKAAPHSAAGMSWLTHVKWLLAAWIAALVLGKLVPGVGFLFIPALLAYAAWVIFKVKRNASGTFMKRLGDLVTQAQHANKK